ncbi:nucleotide sugar dehydrogenase [Ligilactobacillus animalis]|nr:nucleotide sugar dehydrogenase [Ligilactobacillus animalis]
MKIVVVGLGYVGLSVAVLLAQKYDVLGLDIDKKKIEDVNSRKIEVDDNMLKEFLLVDSLKLVGAIYDKKELRGADYVIIATPTNYNKHTHRLDTKIVEGVIYDFFENNKNGIIVVKSTVPTGFTSNMGEKFSSNRILFAPEFLREGKSLEDNLFPSRIVVGGEEVYAKKYSQLLKETCLKKDVEELFVTSTEAEVIKLFSNAYLAMRVAFFNEVDNFSELRNLRTENIIRGICLDRRIGDKYNNPSFGYGGYCFPKDTKQLKYDYMDIPNALISAIVDSNDIRKKLIISQVLRKKPKVVGVYRLQPKKGSDNFRFSAVEDIVSELRKKRIEIIIYEPFLKSKLFNGCKVVESLNVLKKLSDVIIANRYSKELDDVKEMVYTRDIFTKD